MDKQTTVLQRWIRNEKKNPTASTFITGIIQNVYISIFRIGQTVVTGVVVKAVDKCVENRYLNTTTTTTYCNIYPKVRGKEARNFY